MIRQLAFCAAFWTGLALAAEAQSVPEDPWLPYCSDMPGSGICKPDAPLDYNWPGTAEAGCVEINCTADFGKIFPKLQGADPAPAAQPPSTVPYCSTKGLPKDTPLCAPDDAAKVEIDDLKEQMGKLEKEVTEVEELFADTLKGLAVFIKTIPALPNCTEKPHEHLPCIKREDN